MSKESSHSSIPADKCFRLLFRFGIGFAEALALQREALCQLADGECEDALLLIVEHLPIITLGRGGSMESLLVSTDLLKRHGIDFHVAGRGGDITYHGPGQITLYPVFPLSWWKRDLHWYMRSLEEVGIRYLQGHGLTPQRLQGKTGVWVKDEKVAAIGISVSRWITFFGMAVNLQPDLHHYQYIIPCGIEGYGVTSLERLTGLHFDISLEMEKIAGVFCNVFPGARLKISGDG